VLLEGLAIALLLMTALGFGLWAVIRLATRSARRQKPS
jgi:hypothetical protein